MSQQLFSEVALPNMIYKFTSNFLPLSSVNLSNDFIDGLEHLNF